MRKIIHMKFLNEKNRTAIVLLLLPMIFLIVFTFLPFVSVIKNSFYSMTYTKNYGSVGLSNYLTVFETSSLRNAIFTSLYYIASAVVQVVLALVLAVLIFNTKKGTIFKAILFFPYLINGIAIGYIFRIFLTHGSILDIVLQFCGIPLDCLPYWLRDQNINNWVLAGISVWRYFGLSLVIILGALSSVDSHCLGAASLDGAGKIRQFFYISWPSIRKVVLLNLLLSAVSSLSEFEIPYAVASGGANGTSTYMVMIYRIAFTERKIGLASAMTVILLCEIIFLCWFLVSAYKVIDGVRHHE